VRSEVATMKRVAGLQLALLNVVCLNAYIFNPFSYYRRYRRRRIINRQISLKLSLTSNCTRRKPRCNQKNTPQRIFPV
jgi:hypothetical protein